MINGNTYTVKKVDDKWEYDLLIMLNLKQFFSTQEIWLRTFSQMFSDDSLKEIEYKT